MEKEKETPWTEQKVLYKDGNVDVYRKFGWETWKRMTEDERAMWTEFSEATPAPISKEVIDFNEKIVAKANKPKPKAVEVSVDELTEIPDVFEDEDIDTSKSLSEIEQVRAELKERGIKFAYNSKLETLQKKLDDADNTE